jgi:GNAT superfamily N-acetyltransferase
MGKLVQATEPQHLAAVRELFLEYARTVGEPCCFQDFERELEALPGAYGPPGGRLLLAHAGDAAAGCVGLRRLDAASAEMKRLYVRPPWRGRGLGRGLAEAAIGAARELGCSRMLLDSLPGMRAAIALYRTLGFREIEPYLARPTSGARCFELKL